MNDNGIVSPEQLRACSRQLSAGVSVVTTCDAEGYPYGLTMSAVACLSLEPALFLICISEESDTLGPLLESGAFAINILRREQETLARAFAKKGRAEKFKHIAYDLSALTRLPVLRNALGVMECKLIGTYPGGDHRIVVGEVNVARMNGGLPLVHYDGRYLGVDAGREPRDSTVCPDLSSERA